MSVFRASMLGVSLAACFSFAVAAVPDAAPGIDLAGIDHSVAPGDDFFGYANGTWIKNTEIPADRASYGAGVEAKSLSPLKGDIAHIAAITDKQSLSSYLGSTLRADVDALNNTNFYTDHVFGVWVTQALSDPDHNVPYLLQGGLGMPDRDYYLDQSQKMADMSAKYPAH